MNSTTKTIEEIAQEQTEEYAKDFIIIMSMVTRVPPSIHEMLKMAFANAFLKGAIYEREIQLQEMKKE